MHTSLNKHSCHVAQKLYLGLQDEYFLNEIKVYLNHVAEK